MKYGKYVKKC